MKKQEVLYKFELPKEVESEISEETKNEAGEVVITKKKLKETKNFTYGVFRPGRQLKEDAEIYRANQFGKAVEGGTITVALLEKKYLNAGGVFTEEEQGKRKVLYAELLELNKEIKDLESNLTDENKVLIKSKKEKVDEVVSYIVEIEQKAQSLFENTAEAIARNRTIMFYAVNLAAKKNDTGEFEHIFTGDQSDKFDQLETLDSSDNVFDIQAFAQIWSIVGLWYSNPRLTQLDVDRYFAKV